MPDNLLSLEEREAILNREIAAYIAVNSRLRSIVDRTQTTAHLQNKSREAFFYLSGVGCIFTLGLSLLIDIPLRVILRLLGRKIYDNMMISVEPDGTVIKTPQ